eukprot:105108-Chlamydomonas_euryale.AAC.4
MHSPQTRTSAPAPVPTTATWLPDLYAPLSALAPTGGWSGQQAALGLGESGVGQHVTAGCIYCVESRHACHPPRVH